jgi:uncharacterized protein
VVPNASGLVVKPEVALQQTERENASAAVALAASSRGASQGGGTAAAGQVGLGAPSKGRTGAGEGVSAPIVEPPGDLKRFYGTVTVDATRLAREFGRISEEVISHLAGLQGGT